MKGYFHPVRPENHPLFLRRNARAVTREQLKNRINLVALRSFETDEAGNLLHIGETIDAYTEEFRLCDVIWPVYPTLFAPNFGELVDEVKRRGMYMFDFWGYVPGSQPDKENMWGEYTPPPEAVRLLEGIGGQFIGFDNGEQDGRYIGSYAPQMCPAPDDRAALYRNFQAHFEKLEGHMRNNIALLASLNYLHYFAKEGNTLILGAETAQALPNVNLWFSYIRGAGKQYGLLWFGNASVWNRWGWKCYEREENEGSYEECGPECGTSLSLLTRLIYTEYMYGSDILGFEGGWILEREHLLPSRYVRQGEQRQLSPIGIIQENLRTFVEAHPRPGVMHVPVCFYLNFHNGWTMPRHLYSRDIYRVWGNRPYEAGDYQLHALFSMLYPDYENAGFYRDERGFLTATPYGDIADVLFSDVLPAVLGQYQIAVAAGDGALDAESLDKLLSFAEGGGTLVLFAEKLLAADGESLARCGLRSLGGASRPGEIFAYTGEAAPLDRTAEGTPLLAEYPAGKGRVLLVLAYAGLEELHPGQRLPAANPENGPITQVCRLLPAVEARLGRLYREAAILRPDNEALQYMVNGLAPNRFTLLVCNNSTAEEAFSLEAAAGAAIRSVREWEISGVLPDTPGYTPKKKYLEAVSPRQTAGSYRIAPLAVRIFEVETECPAVEQAPECRFLRRTPERLYLAAPAGKSLREATLDLPWFENYFEGWKVDARYLEERGESFLRREGGWIVRRGIRLIVDFSSMTNHYPGLSLLQNIPGRTEEALERIERILRRSLFYGCERAVFSLHRTAENAVTPEQARRHMLDSLHRIKGLAEPMGITAYLVNGRSLSAKGVFSESGDAVAFAEQASLRTAYSLGHGTGAGEKAPRTCGALLLSAPEQDRFGQFSDSHLPLCRAACEGFDGALREALDARSDFVCLDGVYRSADEIYGDLRLLSKMCPRDYAERSLPCRGDLCGKERL